MPDIELGGVKLVVDVGPPGNLQVVVGPPAVPTFSVPPPAPSGGVVVPVPGAPGPPGPAGPQGPSGITPDGSSDLAVAAHISDPEPHPVYDEGPSLLLLYENAKV
jgi:hypothetical protein